MWFDFSERAKFRLTGPDRVRYLNGQVSNQIDQDLSNKAILACVCNLKGKIEGLISVTALGDALMIDAPPEQRESLFTRLDRYLIADDCELEDVTDNFQLWHSIDDQTADSKASNRLGISGVDYCISAEEIFNPTEKGTELDAEKIRIENGMPAQGKELTGEEFPAEVGLDRIAVDFHKGCYLGQEIVSRIESVGKVKRTLVGLTSDDSSCQLREGADLDWNGKNWGKITSVIAVDSKKSAMALVKRTFTEEAEEGNLPEGITFRELRRN